MKCLSIKQPWAWAILHAGKNVENRTWNTHYRGEFAIHAGLHYDYDAFPILREICELVPPAHYDPMPVGCILGIATIVDCVRYTVPMLETNEWVQGPFCFILADARPLRKPIRFTGNLGFFDLPIAVSDAVKRLAGAAA